MTATLFHSPFAAYATICDEETEDEKRQWEIRKTVEKQLRKPVYRVSQWRSVPTPCEFIEKKKQKIVYDSKAGLLQVSKRRLVRVSFHNNVEFIN